MRATEFIQENATTGSTSSGNMAVVVQPVGGMISRTTKPVTAKYMNSFKPQGKDSKHVGR